MGAIMSPGSVWMQELSEPGVGPARATLALSAGFGLGPLVSAVIAETLPHPMVVPYAAHAVTLGAAILGVRSAPEPPTRRTREPTDPRDLVVLARLAPIAPWVFAFAAISVAIVPGLLRSELRHPVLHAGFVIVVTLLTGAAVQRVRVTRPDRKGLALGAFGTLLAAETVAMRSTWLVFVAAILLGAGYGLVVTSGLRVLERKIPAARRGSAVGGYYVLTYVGFALPFVHALVARSFGDVLTLRLWSVLAFGSLVVRVLLGDGDDAPADA
jgi:hypothetical protein